jgi:hypothetical protein
VSGHDIEIGLFLLLSSVFVWWTPLALFNCAECE